MQNLKILPKVTPRNLVLEGGQSLFYSPEIYWNSIELQQCKIQQNFLQTL